MRIGVIGAGAVGGTLAVLLHRAGHPIAVAARPSALPELVKNGITLSGAWGQHTAFVEPAETLPAGTEIAFLCTKTIDTEAAVLASADALRGSILVVVQNGLSGPEIAAQSLPETTVLGGLALFAASYTAPGTVAVTAPGTLYLGVPTAQAERDRLAGRAALGKVLGALRPVLPTRTVDDFRGAQWTKLVVNQVNALPAITGLSVQQTIQNSTLRRILTASMRETVRVGLRAGVHFEELASLNGPMLRAFAKAPVAVGTVLPLRLAAGMGSVPNPGSTLQSIRRGQKTEIDDLNGAVVRQARADGREAPINAALLELVHEVERSGSFLPVAQVAARVRSR